MPNNPNMLHLEALHYDIGIHLAQIAAMLVSDYKLTFVARFPGQHTKTIIVTDGEA